MSEKRGLGKGIGALIPDLDEGTIDVRQGMLQADIDEIKVNPYQPRKYFSEKDISELASSIQEKGVLQPLLVIQDGTGYGLIAGERRLRAARKAGLATVPVIIKEADEKSRQEISLIENIQREDLNVIEEAEAYQSLIQRFNYTQDEVSQKVGRSRTAITNSLRLLKLGKNIKEDLLQKRITMGHARAYLGLKSQDLQEEVHVLILKKGLSVRQAENIIKKLRKDKKGKGKRGGKPSILQIQDDFILDELRRRFATKVNITRKGKKGRVVIEFYSNEEFERIYDLLRG